MLFLECNHVITSIKAMLKGLQAIQVLDGNDVHSLLILLVELRLKNEVLGVRAYIPAGSRSALALLEVKWGILTTADKAVWETGAEGTGMTGYDLFTERGMDQYVIQLGIAQMPASFYYTGVYPNETWVWSV